MKKWIALSLLLFMSLSVSKGFAHPDPEARQQALKSAQFWNAMQLLQDLVLKDQHPLKEDTRRAIAHKRITNSKHPALVRFLRDMVLEKKGGMAPRLVALELLLHLTESENPTVSQALLEIFQSRHVPDLFIYKIINTIKNNPPKEFAPVLRAIVKHYPKGSTGRAIRIKSRVIEGLGGVIEAFGKIIEKSTAPTDLALLERIMSNPSHPFVLRGSALVAYSRYLRLYNDGASDPKPFGKGRSPINIMRRIARVDSDIHMRGYAISCLFDWLHYSEGHFLQWSNEQIKGILFETKATILKLVETDTVTGMKLLSRYNEVFPEEAVELDRTPINRAPSLSKLSFMDACKRVRRMVNEVSADRFAFEFLREMKGGEWTRERINSALMSVHERLHPTELLPAEFTETWFKAIHNAKIVAELEGITGIKLGGSLPKRFMQLMRITLKLAPKLKIPVR